MITVCASPCAATKSPSAASAAAATVGEVEVEFPTASGSSRSIAPLASRTLWLVARSLAGSDAATVRRSTPRMAHTLAAFCSDMSVPAGEGDADVARSSSSAGSIFRNDDSRKNTCCRESQFPSAPKTRLSSRQPPPSLSYAFSR
jgi:hypothetical protein